MKRNLTGVLLMGIIMGACNHTPKEGAYHLRGVVTNEKLEGRTIYLRDAIEGVVRYDSTTVSEGRFVFNEMCIRDRYANSVSPLLIGAQGCGKSTYCRNLLPPDLRAYYTDSIDFSRKRDAELYLNRFMLINMDEFDQVSANHQGFLKHILQKPVLNVRKPNESAAVCLLYTSFIENRYVSLGANKQIEK